MLLSNYIYSNEDTLILSLPDFALWRQPRKFIRQQRKAMGRQTA